jgi:opacity protein-like surface antigen
MMKKFVGLWVAILTLVFGTALFAQQLPMEMMVDNRYVNVRKGPGSGYQRITTLYRGDRVLAERKFKNWLRVLIDDGSIGWVREDLIKPFNPEDRHLSNEQADSVNAVVEELAAQITGLEDRSSTMIQQIRAREAMQDSLLAMLGMDSIPARLDTVVYGVSDTTAEGKVRMESPFEPQQTVMEVSRGWMGRNLYTSRVGVLVYDKQAAVAGGFSFARSFTPELSWRVELESAQFNPEEDISPEGHVVRTALNAGLGYSYHPGSMAVPYALLGAGIMRSSWADSSRTDLDVSFGAGFRMYLTEDVAIDAAYRGHIITVEGKGAELLNGISVGLGIQLPEFYPSRPRDYRGFYLAPFAGVQAFSPRFSVDAAPEAGMKFGWRMYNRLALEAEGSYIPLSVRDREGTLDLSGSRIGMQALYYPMKPDKGLYLMAGGGSILFNGDGRPPEGTSSYSYFNWGAGARLQLNESLSLRGEFSHQIFTDVARLVPEFEVGGASAVRVSGGVNLAF